MWCGVAQGQLAKDRLPTAKDLAAALLTLTTVAAAVSPMLVPDHLGVLRPVDAPPCSHPGMPSASPAALLAASSVVLARRWARMARSRPPAGMAIGHAQAARKPQNRMTA